MERTFRFLSFMAVDGADLSRALRADGMLERNLTQRLQTPGRRVIGDR